MTGSNQGPFKVADFSGGITDDVYAQDQTTAKVLNNFVITSDRGPSTRPGSIVDDLVNPQIPAGIQRISALINYANNDKLFRISSTKMYYRNPSAYATLTGPSGNDVFSAGSALSVPAFSQWNKHLFVTNDSYPNPMKVYKDDGGVYRVRSSGLPGLASSPSVVAGAVGTRSYVYAFHYEYTYMVGDQEFQDVGPVTLFQLTLSGDPSAFPNSVSAIPVLSNTGGFNYDTASVKVFIYRTIDSGQSLYKIGEVTNGTTTFNDNVSDDNAQLGLPLYTDDGTVEFDPPPLCKYLHVVNNTGYYVNIKDGSQIFPYRVRQSIPGDPDSAPVDFYVDVEDEGTGVSSVKSIPIIFCKKYIYRIENAFDQFGRGLMNPVRISDTVGCVSNLSVVQAENYVFWAGNDGFYASDGYQILKLSDHLNDTYQTLLAQQTNTEYIYGKYDEKSRRIYWAIQKDLSSEDNDSLITLDLRWGIKERACFNTWSGNSFMPSSLEFFQGNLWRGDSRGYTFTHNEAYLTDPKVNTLAAASTWSTETIIWTYQSTNISFGDDMFRKMPTRVLLMAKNSGNTTIQISAINDDGKSTRNLKPIRWRRNFVWGDENFVWGDPDCIWAGVGLIEQWRRFPAKGLRLSYLSLVITNAYGVIVNSDTLGSGTFDNTLNTVTLSSPSVWPSASVDYYISTEVDNYEKQYLVTARTSDTVLTLDDTDDTLPTGSAKWLLSGYQKGEVLSLQSYNVFWQPVSQTQNTYEVGQDGANA